MDWDRRQYIMKYWIIMIVSVAMVCGSTYLAFGQSYLIQEGESTADFMIRQMDERAQEQRLRDMEWEVEKQQQQLDKLEFEMRYQDQREGMSEYSTD